MTRIENNQGLVIGKLKIDKHYYGDYARYRDMNMAALAAEREKLRQRKQWTFKAFIRHPTVLPFGLSNLPMMIWILVFWGEALNGLSIGLLLASIGLLLFFGHRMFKERKPEYNGLQMIKVDLALVEAFLAIKQAEVAYGGAELP